MCKLTGVAILDYCGKTRDVQVCINLEDNVIEIWHALPDMLQAFSFLGGGARHSDTAVLRDIRIQTPIGEIKKDEYTDFFITSYNPATVSQGDVAAARILALCGQVESITKIVLQPRSSQIEFKLFQFEPMESLFEIVYKGYQLSFPKPQILHIGGVEVVVTSANGTLIIKASDSSLLNYEEPIRLSMGIILGGPITLRTIINGSMFAVNLASHKGTGTGRLFKRHEDSGVLLQGIIDFLASLEPDDQNRWTRSIYFFLQGLGGVSPLEIRAINLFTSLEIIDNTSTLDKSAFARLLDITTDEADICCRVRNRLLHNGANIGSAVIEAEKELTSFKSTLHLQTLAINALDENQSGVKFFFWFVMQINRLWISKAKFEGDWNDFGEYGL